MKIKFLSAVAVLAIGFASEAAFADDAPAPAAAAAPTPEFTVTGDAAIESQYRFRGISQSNNRPVAQMAITVSDKSGFYVSTWGSSASAGNSTVNIGGTEIDVYGGYTHTYAKSGITIDGGVYGYLYPGAPAGNYFEVYGDVTKAYGPFTVKAGINWAPKQHYFNQLPSSVTHYNIYEYGELGYTPASIPALTFHSHLGHTGGGFDYTKEYIDYTFGAGYKWKNLTFDLSGTGTNVTKQDSHIAPLFDQGLGAGDGGVPTLNPGETHRAAKLVPVLSLTASF